MDETEQSRPDADLAWHYTDSAGLCGILSSHTVFAASAAFMNDANEMRTGQMALRSAFARIKDTLSNEEQEQIVGSSILEDRSLISTFLLSASLEGDELTLWRNYGVAATAYALAFDRSVKLAPVELRCGDCHPSPPPGYYEDAEEEIDGQLVRLYDPDQVFVEGGEWRNVDYISSDPVAEDEAYIRTYVERRVRAARERRILLDFSSLADAPLNFKKDEAFRDEREVRIVIQAMPTWKFVDYRSTKFGLTPFVRLGSASAGAGDEDYVSNGKVGRLPLRKVMIGPTSDRRTKEQALRMMLDDFGYGDVSIDVSGTPFR